MSFASQSNQSAAAAITPLEKDYYQILDIPITATPEQIKE
jgi:curved DNA-binding protein CbpA